MAEIEDQPLELGPLSPERRRRIMDGAGQIFSRDGYEGASMAHIAQAASVSKGTLYNYFPSKDALFAAFVRDNCAAFMAEVFGDIRAGTPVEQDLAHIGRTMLKSMLSQRAMAMFRVVVMEASKFPDLARSFMDAGPRTMVRNMAGWISRRVAAGELTAADPEFAAEQFFALTQTKLVLRARAEAGFCPSEAEIEQVVAGAVRVFLAAYGR